MSDWFYSFRVRLTILFGALSLVIGSATLLNFDRLASERITEASGESLRDMTRAIANSLGENLWERDREISLLAQFPMFVKGDLRSADLRQRMEYAKRAYRYYAWIGVADTRGIVESAAGGLLEGENVSQRPWFIMGREGPYIGDVHETLLLAKKLPNPNAKEPLRFIDFASPVLDEEGRVRGVLATHVHWTLVEDVIRSLLRQEKLRAGVEAFIVSRKGEVLYPFSAIGDSKPPATASINDAYAVVDWNLGERYLTSSVPVKSGVATDPGWRVVLRQPLGEALGAVTELYHALLVLGLLSTIGAMLLAYRFATVFSNPFEQLADVAHRIQQGDENTAFTVRTQTREIARLIDSLRGMTHTLIARKRALQESNALLEHKVEERTAELSDLYNHSPVGYHSVGPDGSILHINDRELQWLGYEREEVVGKMHVLQLVHPENEPAVLERHAALKSGVTPPSVDWRMLRKDGSLLDVRVSSTAAFDAQGRFVMSRTAIIDVSDQRKLELELRRQEALNQAIVRASASGLLLYRDDGQCILANQAAADIAGTTVEKLLEQNFHYVPHWRVTGLYECALKALAGQENQCLISVMSSFGKPMDCLMTAVPIWHDSRPMVLLVAKDVSELVKVNREPEKLARHDTLTDLFNRLAATERLREEFLRMKRTGTVYSLLLMDIDHFKRVNDTYGHETGDHVLKHVAEILLGCARATDVVARFGGEEFLLILPDTQQEGAMVVGEKIRIAVAGSNLPLVGSITVSVGLATVGFADLNEDEAVRLADQALYRAKNSGRNRIAA